MQGFQNHDIIHNPLIWFKIFRPFLLKKTKQTKKKTTTTYSGSSTPKPVEVHSDKSPNTGKQIFYVNNNNDDDKLDKKQ